MQVNDTLTSLDLRSNDITDTGLRNLTTQLVNSTVHCVFRIDLRNNQLTPKDIHHAKQMFLAYSMSIILLWEAKEDGWKSDKYANTTNDNVNDENKLNM